MCTWHRVCRKTLEERCVLPIVATRDEEPRPGAVRCLRAALSGSLPLEEFTSNGCTSARPCVSSAKVVMGNVLSNVDMAKIKYEFLAHYYQKHGCRFVPGCLPISRPSIVGVAACPVVQLVHADWLTKQGMRAPPGSPRPRSFPPFARA